MAFVPVTNVAMCELIFLWDGQVCENTIYVEDPAGFSTADLVALAGLLDAWHTGDVLPQLSNAVSLTKIKCTDLSSSTAPAIEYVTSLPVSGGSASPSLPNNVAACITFLTDQRGRSFRGRNYIPGMVESGVSANAILPALAAAFVTGYTALAADLVAAGQTHCVVSRYTNGVPRANGLSTLVTGYRTSLTVASMRRRLPGRGA